ncbi:protein of unknown function [Rhodovastum atsumiense]|uniref:hypothetical protein n=1 Tax=Rhodovastum atsumiense TaxID=504468 RepID=UPI001EF0A408|nr:hypothetical protein [Rhodovastum atsumiense]CAH2600050.1 protein of unknown function [Rhodovastum atsumiense]
MRRTAFGGRLAHDALQRAGRLAEQRHDARAASLSLGSLGELYATAGRRTEAAMLAAQAIFQA